MPPGEPWFRAPSCFPAGVFGPPAASSCDRTPIVNPCDLFSLQARTLPSSLPSDTPGAQVGVLSRVPVLTAHTAAGVVPVLRLGVVETEPQSVLLAGVGEGTTQVFAGSVAFATFQALVRKSNSARPSSHRKPVTLFSFGDQRFSQGRCRGMGEGLPRTQPKSRSGGHGRDRRFTWRVK